MIFTQTSEFHLSTSLWKRAYFTLLGLCVKEQHLPNKQLKSLFVLQHDNMLLLIDPITKILENVLLSLKSPQLCHHPVYVTNWYHQHEAGKACWLV